MTHDDSERAPIPWWLGLVLLSGIALYFLWDEHEAHIRGALPYLLFLACPLIHLFMHGGHGHGGPKDAEATGGGPRTNVHDHSQHGRRQT